MMKRLASTIVFACAVVVVSASTALASSTYPPSSQSVEATSGSRPPGGTTAFTGSDVSRLVLVIAVLLVVGLATLAIVRRRSRTLG
jgi:hypothetical protein